MPVKDISEFDCCVLTAKNHERKIRMFRATANNIDRELFYYDYPQNVAQKEKAFGLRYQIFCLECGYIPEKLFPDKRVKDDYDDIASTKILVALNSGNKNGVLGTVRAIRDPKNKLYNSKEVYDSKGKLIDKLPIENHVSLAGFRDRSRNIGQVTSLAVGYERGKKISFGLLKSAYLDCLDNNIDDVFIQANPYASWMFEAIGFKKMFRGWYKIVDDYMGEENIDVPVVGMHLDMHNVNEHFLRYFDKSSSHFLFRTKTHQNKSAHDK